MVANKADAANRPDDSLRPQWNSARQGFAQITVVEIAERAGYSRVVVRTRFGTKNDLVGALLHVNYEDQLTESPAPNVLGL